MPKLGNAIPRYFLHKQSGRGIVRLSGKDVYFPGPYGSTESRAAYDQFVSQWLASGRRLPGSATPAPTETASAPTVDEIVLKFLEFARTHYAERGNGTSEVENLKAALRPLQKLFGSEPAREIGPKRLKMIQAEMIQAGLSRPGINAWVRRIVRVYRWAASEELIPAETYHGLKTVQGLQRGRGVRTGSIGLGCVRGCDPRSCLPASLGDDRTPTIDRSAAWGGCLDQNPRSGDVG